METVTLTKMDYHEFEDIVHKAYGFGKRVWNQTTHSFDYPDAEYEFVAVQECGNDSSHEFHATGKIDEHDKENATKIRAGKEVPMYYNTLLFECLVADGHLPAGRYLIDASW